MVAGSRPTLAGLSSWAVATGLSLTPATQAGLTLPPREEYNCVMSARKERTVGVSGLLRR